MKVYLMMIERENVDKSPIFCVDFPLEKNLQLFLMYIFLRLLVGWMKTDNILLIVERLFYLFAKR